MATPNIPTIYIITKSRTVVDNNTGGYACLTETIKRFTRDGADESYFAALAEAARNTEHPIMGVTLTTNYGEFLEGRVYIHETETETETE